ncbi:LuxR C-terminal-related transcriptional regulator [Fusobacterium nucleatum]|uniref:LuxR C-terminal-related transcriptional regulator n=1 Tax=Fusobacterium nucleatum TaxID=851 RepID=UPI0007643E39|nr:LuxR C-terminal-related transcriptional regulator [Fusobacterium nucleatum]
MSTRQEVYKLIIEKKDNKEIAAALNISIRTVERYRKDFNSTINDSDIKTTTTSDNIRKKKEKARALIETGETITEVANKVGLARSTIGDISSKEKLQVKQLDYLKSFREEYREQITKNKKDRLNLNNKAKEKIEYTLNLAEDITKDTQKLIEMNEETEQKIFELDRIERLERFELEKAKYKDNRLNIITEELANLTESDIEKILQIIEKSKEVDKNE